MFKFQPRQDTPWVKILHDTAMIEIDFAKAKKEQEKAKHGAKSRASIASQLRNKGRRK